MIRSITIKNFQKHTDKRIDFSPTVTCLVGKTDSGKSSIIRAIRWVCLNRPNGDSFKRHREDSVSVSLDLDKVNITRSKTKGKNAYHLGDKEFVALGQTGVPEEIQGLLNVTEDNFALQHDPPYWLHLSAGELSRELNKIVDLTQMDKSLAYIASESRKNRSEIQVCEERACKARQDEENLRWTLDAHEDLKAIESLLEAIEGTKQRLESLQRLLDKIDESKKELDSLRKRSKPLQEILPMMEVCIKESRKLEELKRLYSEIQRAQEDLLGIKERQKKVQNLLSNVKSCPLCGNKLKE